MLDNNAKKILKMLNSLIDEYGIIDNSKLITDNIPKGYNATKLISTLEYLQSLNYLEFADNIVQEVTFVRLHHKGLNYKNIEWVEVKSFIIKSVLVPIVVAFITTLLIEWLL